MILPDRVFGNPGANWIRSGDAVGPITLRTCGDKFFLQRIIASLTRH